ncbi:regulatory protein RecX [Pyxidicoccus sp. 3LG]
MHPEDEGPPEDSGGSDLDDGPDAVRRATDACLKLLSMRSRSRQELEQALTRKGFAPKVREEALVRVQGWGYLDDARFAQERAASLLRIRDWTFDLSPYEWDARGTLVLFKFSGEKLSTLAADPARWTAAEDFNPDVASTRERLLAYLADAASRTDPDFVAFNQLVEDPNWNGILFLDVRVPLASLPPQLVGLAAGIDPAEFSAHHVGINVNPLSSDVTTPTIQDSSLFGLIAYESPDALFFQDRAYDYKVSSLKVLFRNSLIQRFSSQVLVMVNQLFGEPATLVGSIRGNNLLLDGVYQRQGDQDSYVFLRQGEDVFTMTSGVLYNIEVRQTQFVTVNPPRDGAATAPIQARFQLWGTLRFKALAGFDALSFGPTLGEDGKLLVDGGLSFANLALDLTFEPLVLTDKVFSFNAGSTSFDLTRSRARERSLFQRFPLTLAGLVQAREGSTPQSLGFSAVDAPLGQSGVKFPWFGLQLLLDLGTPGGLAARVDFRATLLAAWSPNARGLSFFLGLSLPGMTGGKREITLQGALKLAIGGFQFTVSPESEFMLRFNNIALKFFLLRFPPSGQTTAYLFGNPDRQNTDKALGWYAAFAKPGFVPPRPPTPPPPPPLLRRLGPGEGVE